MLDHFRTLPVTKLWGGGIQASADMMSLDATRRLWTARHDPRRRTPAVGTYTHVLDQWVILHDQAVVLNRRQAGAAIEGALRHEAVDLHRVAVDTHGCRATIRMRERIASRRDVPERWFGCLT